MVKNKKADMRIQQMTFMILFVFIFFTLAGLFFARVQLVNLKANYADLQKDLAIASIEPIARMAELSYEGDCTGLCLDEDKLFVFASKSDEYKNFLPVASISVLRLTPQQNPPIVCPAENCNLYKVYESNQKNVIKYGTFASICKRVSVQGRNYEKCDLARLDVGVKLKE